VRVTGVKDISTEHAAVGAYGSKASEAPPEFDDFYAGEFEAVAALAYVLSGSALAAEDLAQEAFLAAYRRWGEIGHYDNPGGWVRRAVANRSVSTFRRRAAEARAIARIGYREPLPDLTPESADVWQAVRRLPRRQAQVVALYYLEDRSLDEVAEVLAMSVETVRTHLRRGRQRLARRLRLEE
jgi:RNA polymerase sigma factor (sigma-70 family)